MKRSQTAKSNIKWTFLISLSTSAGLPRPQSKLKTTKHTAICGTLIISCNSNIDHSLTCSKIWEKYLNGKKYHFWSFFLSLITPPCRFRSQKETQSIRHKTMKRTLLIFIKYSMICNWTCPKSWENGPQRPKALSQVSAILHTNLDYKRKGKHLSKQLHVALLSLHAILI